ncbi:MAG: hypothetical protein M3Y40_02870 [Chloroflexota bacterium]|nr:hypothetical protein [Chloroflexota bacterium]
MTTHRSPLAAIAPLVLVVVLAACSPAAADEPSAVPSPSQPAAPSAPAETPRPSTPADPSPEPSEAPAETPAPATPGPSVAPTVLDRDPSLVARIIADAVNVRSLPDLQAALHVGRRYSDDSIVPNMRVNAGDRVFVTLGPVIADGHAWYEVSMAEGDGIHFEGGWVSGQFLEIDGDVPSYDPVYIAVHGNGSGAAASGDLPADAPITVRFAAGPTDGRDSCELDVTLIGTDGLAVNVATETMTDTRVYQLSTFQYPSLYQEEAGRATLQVKSDCTFAATVSIPQG